jgi:hypothetical protein
MCGAGACRVSGALEQPGRWTREGLTPQAIGRILTGGGAKSVITEGPITKGGNCLGGRYNDIVRRCVLQSQHVPIFPIKLMCFTENITFEKFGFHSAIV